MADFEKTQEEKNDKSIIQCDSVAPELPIERAGKSINELTQELMYDLDRERDVEKRADKVLVERSRDGLLFERYDPDSMYHSHTHEA